MHIHSFLTLLIAFLLMMPGGGALAQGLTLGGAGEPHIRPYLEAESGAPAPGSTVTLAIVMEPESGWHGYWENPGDAGKPLDLKWDLPAGATVGALRYPVPHVLLVAGLMNHVYEGRYAVLVDLHLPDGLTPGAALPVRAHADWLACTDSICVPERADLALDLIVGRPGGEAKADKRALFDGYRRALPRPLGGTALFQADRQGGLRLAIPFPRAADLEDAHFFALTPGMKSYAAPQGMMRDGDRLVVILADFPAPAGALRGVLRIGPDQGVEIDARAGMVPPPSDGAQAVVSAGGAAGGGAQAGGAWNWSTIVLAFGGALVGGLILNIMPCVFPILSLKAMSLLRSGASGAHARHEAWAYTAGVVLTCVALGGTVLLLRAGGESIGWAFQLQSPAVIVALLALSVAIALNFAGLFELASLQLDGGLTTRRGLSGDFWSGVLVAFAATPCTGPFMAAALGAALLLPVAAALAIFAGLGLGIALPFLLLGYVPALRARMPRPGPWMERVRRWLSVPMALTAAALLWLLWRQAGGIGFGAGVAVTVAVMAFLWWLGRRQRGGHHEGGPIVAAGCLLAVAGGAVTLARLPADNAYQAAPANAFSEAVLAQARAGDKPLFLYFTADWCLSCKVNEAAAIDRAEVRAAFEKAGVRTMIGDWTNGDPAITRFLEDHGRSGVPLYLWYPGGGAEPRELPQILTPSLLTGLAEKGA
ncbi:MAG: protein-disulfide reductase DsbD family protein [Sphingobium sp.]